MILRNRFKNQIMDASFKLPFYVKAALISISAFAFIYTLYIGQQIIIPILYATILAILLNPFVNFLTRKKFNRILAISIAVGLMVFMVLAIIYMLSSQISMFAETYPQLKAKFDNTSIEFVQWLSEKFNIRARSPGVTIRAGNVYFRIFSPGR